MLNNLLGTSLCALLMACASAPQLSEGPGPGWHPPAQSSVHLVLETSSGRRMDLADHRGRALLVAAVSSDNLMSQALVRDLERLARAHDPADLAAVVILGDSAPPRDLPAILDSYAHVLELTRVTLCIASEEIREGASALGAIERVPVLFFFNRAGALVRRIEGHPGYASLQELIAPALPR